MMNTNTLKANSIFKKVVAAVAAAAIAIGIAAGFGTQRVQAAEAKIFFDENATVCLNSDGSGYILCDKVFTREDPLTEVDGVALKDIITFNDGGYVEKFYVTSESRPICSRTMVDTVYTIYVYASGPEGFTSGSGHLHFTDATDDTYNLAIWLHSPDWHYVNYHSGNGRIVKISWNS